MRFLITIVTSTKISIYCYLFLTHFLVEELISDMKNMRLRIEKLENENEKLRSSTVRKKPKVVVRDSTRVSEFGNDS